MLIIIFRLTSALESDIRRWSTDEDNEDEVDPFGGGENDRDGDYLSEEDASNIE